MAYDDWIKMRKVLTIDGRVRKMSRTLRTHPLQIVGALFVLWCLADDLCASDGVISGYTVDELDAQIGIPGFVLALPVDWCEIGQGPETIVILPNYGQHNGSTAKSRAVDSKRKILSRKCPGTLGHLSGKRPSKSGTDKRRGDKSIKTPLPPKGGVPVAPRKKQIDSALDAQALSLYAAYPVRKGKQAALRAIRTALKGTEFKVLMVAVEKFSRSPDVVDNLADPDRKRFVKHPSTWFNQQCWLDEDPQAGTFDDIFREGADK